MNIFQVILKASYTFVTHVTTTFCLTPYSHDFHLILMCNGTMLHNFSVGQIVYSAEWTLHFSFSYFILSISNSRYFSHDDACSFNCFQLTDWCMGITPYKHTNVHCFNSPGNWWSAQYIIIIYLFIFRVFYLIPRNWIIHFLKIQYSTNIVWHKTGKSKRIILI